MNDDWDSASKATPPDTLNVAQTPQPKRKRPIVPDNLVLDNSVTPEDKPHTEEDTHIPHLAQSDWDSVSSATPTNSTPDDWDSVSEPQPAPQPRLVPPDNLVFTAPDPLSLPVAPPIPPEPALYVEDGFLPLPPLLRRRRRFSMNKLLLFSILAVLLVIGGSIGAFQGIRIYNANIAATATVQAGATVSAQTNATATATAQAVPTVTTEQQIYNQATSRTPAVDDPLSDDRNSWGVFTTAWGGQCAFTGGAYHLSLSKVGYWLVCTGGSMGVLKSSVNFALQVQISIVQGNYGGIIF